ncbi:heavy metal-binding domain-containing protein [Candidatus Micrarchaeota archaeon]|nr:heavy metal-binding domain-containing protein [Candidatus Micrarchaeota archaeon]
MIVATTGEMEQYKIKEVLGIVRGNTVRAKWIGKDFLAGLRQFVGGELTEYTEMMTEARDEAFKRMMKEAEEKGADAVLEVRFTSSDVMASAAEILVYGTAVKLRK